MRFNGRIIKAVVLGAVFGSCAVAFDAVTPVGASVNRPLITCPQGRGVASVDIGCSGPVPTPAPTAPPAQPTRSTDVAALVAIANSFAHVCAGSDFSCTDHLGIVGSYALVGYSDNNHVDGYFLATKSSGTWTVLSRGGGWMNQSDLLAAAPALGASAASQLESVATPIWNGQ